MPLRHSPPPPEAELRSISVLKTLAQHSDTDPPWTGSEEEARQPAKTTQRSKRKHDGTKDGSDSRAIVAEMRMLFGNLAAEYEKKMENLQKKFDCIDKLSGELHTISNDLREGRQEISEFIQSCKTRMDLMDNRILEIEKKLDEKATEPKNQLDSVVAELRQQLNERDQEMLLNDIEISNVPEISNENTVHLVKLLSATLGVDVDDREIVLVERVGSTRRDRVEGALLRPRTIVLRVARRSTRDQLLRAARVRRGLTTAALDMSVEPPRRVYINERLTRTNRQLFGRAREHARKLGWKYVWTRDGKIFTRKEDGKQVDRIRTDRDIEKIFGTGIV